MSSEDIVQQLEAIAREDHDTTPADVVSAVRNGTLSYQEASAVMSLAERLPADHPVLNDDDPDDRAGWYWCDGDPQGE